MPHIYENGIKKTYKENKTHKMENTMLGDKAFTLEYNDLEHRLCFIKTVQETQQILDDYQKILNDYFRIVSPINMLYAKTKFQCYSRAYNIINRYKNKTEESK